MTNYTNDPLSACCGDPGDCSRAHLYCFNRSPKEADVDAMRTFEATFDKTRQAAQAAINGATHGSTVDVAEATAALARIAEQSQAAQALGEVREKIAATDAKLAELDYLLDAPAKDEIKRPDHYARFAIEPCTFIMLNELPYWTGNVIKYVTRAPHKHADERIDIRKAIRYCEMRIEELDRVAAGTDGDVIRNPL